MSLMTRVLIGLVAGLLLGMALRAAGEPAASVAGWIEPIGTLWINAIRMTVIPLVVSILITAIGDAGDVRRIGRLGLRAVVLFFVMLGATAAVVTVLAPLAFAWLQLDPAETAGLRATAADIPEGISAIDSAREFLLSFIPPNPIAAAAQGAILPLIVFSVLFALAVSRISPEPGEAVMRFFRGIRDATFVLIGWILAVAPIGVFALGVALGANLGGTAAGAVGYYIGLVILIHVVTGAALYLVAAYFGRVRLDTFARAVAPAQAVAISSRSSLASLPALIEGANRVLRLPPQVTSLVLPLAVAIFKLTSPIYWTLGALLVARLYGVELSPAQVGTMAAAAVLLNPATPGIPSGGLFIQAPVYLAIGLPVEGIGLLIAVDAVPDMFKTAFNVTADMTVATIVARGENGGGRPAAQTEV